MTRRNRPTVLQDFPEHRAIPIDQVEFSDGEDEHSFTLTGYASTFQPYEMYGGPANGGWIEQLDKRAFDKTLKEKPDLHLLINHAGMPLARTKSGTLDLSVDDHGLKVVARLDRRDPEAESVYWKMDRGDMDEMSFAFRVKAQRWESTPEFRDDPEALRTITEVSLHKGDVSVVNWGANPTTHAEVLSAPALLRALAECDLAEVRSDDDLVKRAMEKLSAVRADGVTWIDSGEARDGLNQGLPGLTGTLIDGIASINNLELHAADGKTLADGARYSGQVAGIAVAGILEALSEKRADADGVNEAIAALDAVIDQACALVCDADREGLDPAVGQALDLICGADTLVDELMECLGIPDPDEDDERAEESDAEERDDMEEDSAKEPYGDVAYADPGYRDGKKRYPLDSAAHVRAAWSYINMPRNADKYSAEQLSEIKDRIKAAAKKFGVEISDEEKSADVAVHFRCEDLDRPMIISLAKKGEDGSLEINISKRTLVSSWINPLTMVEAHYRETSPDDMKRYDLIDAERRRYFEENPDSTSWTYPSDEEIDELMRGAEAKKGMTLRLAKAFIED